MKASHPLVKPSPRLYRARLGAFLMAIFSFPPFLATETSARTFYNDAGKSIEAELIGMEDEIVIFKLNNGNQAKVPLGKLAKPDQLFIKTWWAKNKNLLTEKDVKLSISRSSSYIKKPTTKNGKDSRSKSSESEVVFTCKLDNYSNKTVSGIKASYSTYKRVSTRDKNGSNSHVDIIADSTQLDVLVSHKSLTFTTEGVKCVDSSFKPVSNPRNPRAKRAPRTSHSETVFGFVITLSAGGKEILTKCHPENFLRRLEEEEEREERRIDEKDAREDRSDRGASSRKDREDIRREQRKNKALQEKKEREAERRRKIEDRESDYKDRNSGNA